MRHPKATPPSRRPAVQKWPGQVRAWACMTLLWAAREGFPPYGGILERSPSCASGYREPPRNHGPQPPSLRSSSGLFATVRARAGRARAVRAGAASIVPPRCRGASPPGTVGVPALSQLVAPDESTWHAAGGAGCAQVRLEGFPGCPAPCHWPSAPRVSGPRPGPSARQAQIIGFRSHRRRPKIPPKPSALIRAALHVGSEAPKFPSSGYPDVLALFVFRARSRSTAGILGCLRVRRRPRPPARQMRDPISHVPPPPRPRPCSDP
ncbi:hypothetical protein DFJ74DRAFT_532776 [Hyaloraphidium curvatum]|nr:hypothetical protein DFJ74DRAFT_532776 [Hyaloraphidium curvatum]